MSRIRLCSLFSAICALAALSAAPGAMAGTLADSAASCEEQTLSQPFLRWADVAQYTLAPGGAAESDRGWTLTGAADVAKGNEPWNVHADRDDSSLALPAGSSATTAAMCVGLEHPDLRYFARGSGATRLRTEVLYQDIDGRVQALTIGFATPAGGWAPTAPMVLGVNLLAAFRDGHTAVAFRFTPEGTGTWRIDDVYVDPYGRN